MKQKKAVARASVLVLVAMLAAFSSPFLHTQSVTYAQEAVPAAPTLTATAGAGQITLTWETVENAVRYELQARESGAEWQPLDDALTGTSYTHENLTPGTTYEYRIRALNDEGVAGEWSQQVQEIPEEPGETKEPGEPPAAPTLTATAGVGQITLKWETVANAATYELWGRVGDTEWELLTDGLTGTSHTHEDLTPGTTYDYRIRGLSAEGVAGEWSQQVQASPEEPAGPPAAPTLTTTADVGTVTLRWQAVENAVSYELQGRESGTTEWQSLDDALTGTSFTHENLTPETTYDYRIRALNADALAGEWSEQAQATPRKPAAPAAPPAAPTLTTTAGADQITLKWETVATAVSYEVMWRTDDIDWESVDVVLTGTSYTHENLTPGTVYHYRIRALNAGGKAGAWSERVKTAPGPPAAPRVIANPGVDEITVKWSAGSNAVSYELEWKEANTSWQSVGGVLTVTSYTHKKRTAWTTYYYRVRALNAGGVPGAWSEHVSATAGRPAAPTLTATAGAGQITLTWNTVTGAASYELIWQDDVIDWEGVGGVLTGTSYTHSGRKPGTTYYYRIRALDTDGVTGAWSDRAKAIPEAAPPAAPPAAPTLTATAGGGQITLTWQTVANAVSYELASKHGNTDWQSVGGVLTGTSYTHSGLTPGTTYYYRIRALNANSVQGAWSAEVQEIPSAVPVATPVPTPAAPTLTATAGGGQIMLTWQTVANAVSYELASKDGDADWQSVGGVLTGTSYTHENLTAGTTYHYRIRGLNANGVQGAWSAQVQEIPAAPPPAAPTLTATAGASQITLTWQTVANAVSYELEWKDGNTGWQSVGGVLTGTSYTHENLTPGTTYQYRIRAVNANGVKGEWSAGLSVPVTTTSPDKEALVALYRATGGDHWRNKNNWLSNQPLNAWHGVTTDGSGRVTGLDLAGKRLRGSIPSEQLGKLTNLTALNLSGNELRGSIPSELGKLTNLTTLNLSGNRLNGSIPSELGKLTNLTALNLSGNKLNGAIPFALTGLTNLTVLRLDNNQISGRISPELSKLTKLTVLNLSNNRLKGSIPFQLGRLTNLTKLELDSNELRGSIPYLLTKLTNLEWLILADNKLSGRIPSGMDNLSNLKWLLLYNNKLSGSIPPALSNLSNLTTLYLHKNQLRGRIPPALGKLTSLTALDLSDNNLSESIPSKLGNLTNLTALWLHKNRLSESIPSELGNLTNLTTLWLHNNKLSGSIPSELGNLTNLSTLSLSRNELTGCMPAAWRTIASNDLSTLGLSFCSAQ